MATKRNSFPGLYWDKKSGEGSIDKRINGKRVRHRFKADTRGEAEAEYLRAITSAEAQQAQQAKPRIKTFLDAATKYLNESTKASLARAADSLEALKPYIGHLPLDQVHQGTIEPFVVARREDGIKSATIARDIAVIRQILTKAARVWRDAEGRPWLPLAVPLFEVPNWNDAAQPYPLSRDEELQLLQALPKHLADMALFGLHTGQREQVICSLRWEWEQRIPELGISVFVIPGNPVERIGWEGTKNRSDAVIVLNRIARRAVEAQRGADREWVFVYRGHRVERMNNSGWRRAWNAAGLPRGPKVLAGVHNLRHTFGRRLRLAGVPLETRKVLMDHANGDITVHYSPAELRELLDAVERLAENEGATLLRAVHR